MRRVILAFLFILVSTSGAWVGYFPGDFVESPGLAWAAELLSINSPPVVSDIPDQTISVGGNFVPILLDEYVEHAEDPDSLITWDHFSDDASLDLSVSILDRVATITMPDLYWYGSDTISFTATDTEGLSDTCSVVFTSYIELRYTPDDTTITQGETSSLSIWIDQPIDLRTAEFYVEYDPSILTSIGGHSGQLFADTGVFIWEGFEVDTPGLWRGYAVVMGAGVWVTGPGELFVWEFEGSNQGFSSVVTDSLALYEAGAALIPYAELPPTNVNVSGASSITVPPETQIRASLSLAPNPFNPSTRLTFSMPGTGSTKIDAYDIRGQKVAEIWKGWSNGLPLSITWDGIGNDGRSLPSGSYLIRLEGPGGVTSIARGILLK